MKQALEYKARLESIEPRVRYLMSLFVSHLRILHDRQAFVSITNRLVSSYTRPSHHKS